MRPIHTSIAVLFLLILHGQILRGQITLTTVTDPELTGVRPTNITSGPNGEVIMMKGTKIYTYTDQVTDVFTCSICGDILDITFVVDTMYIANGTKGIVKKFGDSTLQVTVMRATRLVSTNDGNIFGIHNLDGIIVWNGSQWTQMTTSNSTIPTDEIYDMALDDAGVLWMGTIVGLVSWNGTTFSTISVPSGLSAAFFDIEIDSLENIWVASAFGGVGKYDESNWTTYSGTFSPGQRVENLAILNGSEIWTSESGQGLYRYTGDSFEFIPFADLGQTGWEINRVLYGDRQNRLWIQNDFSPLMYLTTTPTSIKNYMDTNIKLKVFPNPFSNLLNISINNFVPFKFRFCIIDMNGLRIYDQKIESEYCVINVEKLIPGNYKIIIYSPDFPLYSNELIIKHN